MDFLSKLILHNDTDQIHIGEAYAIWTQLVARYDSVEVVQDLINRSHDKDLILLLKKGLTDLVLTQISTLEKMMQKYKIQFPPRPPKKISSSSEREQSRDEIIYRIVFNTGQSALMFHVKAINICINDNLRSMFIDFLKDELEMYNSLVKYGKFKGWVKHAPVFHSDLDN